MTLVSNWMHVDVFKVDQAAALWAGYDPAGLYMTDRMKPSEVYAAKQMLVSGIMSGELPANSSANRLMVSIGDYSETLVSRTELEKFARKRKLFPAFLFDTLAPFEGTGGISGNGKPPTARTLPSDPPSNPPAPIDRGGRPAEHDWNAFFLEIVRRANRPDGLPETQAELVRDMLAWFLSTYGREPAESSVKERVSKVYKHLAKAENPDR